jgi:hypothetical protein
MNSVGIRALRRYDKILICARRDGCQTYNGGDRESSAPEKGGALSLPRRRFRSAELENSRTKCIEARR